MSERARSECGAVPQASDLGPRKTMLVLVIVVGCFAVLWPKVFYPMLVGSANQHIKPSAIDKKTGCCDVISEIDVNTIAIMSELCGTIIKQEGIPGNEIVRKCKSAVLETCGIDISAALQDKTKLGQSVKQIISEVRSLNGSLCLKYNFGIAPWTLGVPHRVHLKPQDSNIRQERPLHLRAEMVHPAFRERGRAIPQAQPASASRPPPRIVEGRPGPIPGMRPTMGGPGHVVAPKQSAGSIGVLMPIYTIGIVIFFTYTVLRLVFKKQPNGIGAGLYPPVEPDPQFRKEVFESHASNSHKLSRDGKLVVNAMSALLDEVDQEIEARRKLSDPEVESKDTQCNGAVNSEEVKDQPTVKVIGLETRASCEGGKKWPKPLNPLPPPPPPEPVTPPQEIFLEGALPPQSSLLVADSAIEEQNKDVADPAVVLAGKMTLSVISLDSSENGTDDSDKRREEEVRSSNGSSAATSDEFEKIDADLVEDQVEGIIQEAVDRVGELEDDEEEQQKEQEKVDMTKSSESSGTVEDIEELLDKYDEEEEVEKKVEDLRNALKLEKVEDTQDEVILEGDEDQEEEYSEEEVTEEEEVEEEIEEEEEEQGD